MATIYETAAASLIADGATEPAVLEQVGNYVLTGLGYDAAGNANSPKYVDLSPTWTVSTLAAYLTVPGITDPPGIEKVFNLVFVP